MSVDVAYEQPLQDAVMLGRRKRFFADLRMADGTEITAHLANTGSMRGCWEPGAPVRVRDSGDPKRRLPWSVEQIRVGGHWIVVNTARANAVVAAGLARGAFQGLDGEVRREVRLGESRVDFLLAPSDRPRRWVEVKSVTLLEGEALRFPDAVSVRARRHVMELAEAVRGGDQAVMLFLASREGGREVGVAEAIDPAYAHAVREAVEVGVRVLAWRAVPSVQGITVAEPLPVRL